MTSLSIFSGAAAYPDVFRPSVQKGAEVSRNVDRAFQGIKRATTASKILRSDGIGTVGERLYDARAQFKVFVSKVSMHLPREWVTGLFRQIDSVLDADEWDDREPAPTFASSQTFIRLLLTLRVKRRPGIGTSTRGNLVAAWTVGKNLLTVECLPNDHVHWTLRRERGDEVERAAGTTKIDRVSAILAAYEPDIWFSNGE